MNMMKKLETKLADIFSQLPHLPANVRLWLAQNIWWIVMVVTVIIAINLFLFTIGALLVGALFTAGGFLVGGPIGGAIGGIALVISTIIFIFTLIAIVILSLAITHLKTRRKRGWYLLFILQMVGMIFTAIAFLLTFEPLTMLFNLLSIAIGLYLLFEIREYFGDHGKATRENIIDA